MPLQLTIVRGQFIPVSASGLTVYHSCQQSVDEVDANMRYKILAIPQGVAAQLIATFVVPLCLSAPASAETFASVSTMPSVPACVSCQPLATAQAVPIAQGDWQKFSSTAGRFSVLMPGTPTEETQTDKIEDGRTYQQYYFTVTQPEGVYFVAYSEFPGSEVSQVDADTILEAASEGILVDGGRLLSQREISLEGYPGREIEYEDSEGNLSNTRIFLVEERLYQLIAIASNSDDVSRFFDSFELKP